MVTHCFDSGRDAALTMAGSMVRHYEHEERGREDSRLVRAKYAHTHTHTSRNPSRDYTFLPYRLLNAPYLLLSNTCTHPFTYRDLERDLNQLNNRREQLQHWSAEDQREVARACMHKDMYINTLGRLEIHATHTCTFAHSLYLTEQ
jgi:hypothetical protein